MNEDLNIEQFSIPTEVEVINDRFANDDRVTHIKLSLATDQQYQANRIHIGKELLQSKMESTSYMPIFGLIKVVENNDGTINYEMGDHETELVCRNGKLQYESKTVILGVGIDGTAKYESITRNNVTKDYVTFEALLYSKKYPQLKTLTTTSLNASMEISGIVKHYDEEMGRYEIDDFNLDAHCLLGENVKPAYEQAGVLQVFSEDSFKDEYLEIMKEIKFSLDAIQKGDVSMDNETQEQNMTQESDETNEQENMEQENVDNDNENFELSHDDVRKLLTQKLDTYDSNGYRNYDIWVAEVFDTYCIYEDNTQTPYKYYKAQYTKENNDVVIGTKEEIFATWLTQSEIDKISSEQQMQEQKYSDLANKFAELQCEIDTLRQFKSNIEKAEADAKFEAEKLEKENLIKSFSNRLSKEEIDSVVTDIEKQSFDEIKTGLSIAFTEKALSENKEEERQTFANIGSNKAIDTKAKLLAEMKARKNNKK